MLYRYITQNAVSPLPIKILLKVLQLNYLLNEMITIKQHCLLALNPMFWKSKPNVYIGLRYAISAC